MGDKKKTPTVFQDFLSFPVYLGSVEGVKFGSLEGGGGGKKKRFVGLQRLLFFDKPAEHCAGRSSTREKLKKDRTPGPKRKGGPG